VCALQAATRFGLLAATADLVLEGASHRLVGEATYGVKQLPLLEHTWRSKKSHETLVKSDLFIRPPEPNRTVHEPNLDRRQLQGATLEMMGVQVGESGFRSADAIR
jgi:hypothetical protein